MKWKCLKGEDARNGSCEHKGGKKLSVCTSEVVKKRGKMSLMM
jgi:hypothetical protein